jgi:hypothetical protein
VSSDTISGNASSSKAVFFAPKRRKSKVLLSRRFDYKMAAEIG